MRASSRHKPRTGLDFRQVRKGSKLYVATNDGYLHAVDSASGVEQWAFVPKELLPRLKQLLANPAVSNRTYGLDGRIGLGESWTFDWWGSKTETPGKSGDDFAYSARAGYQTGNWNNGIRFVQVGDAFNPEVGFLNRSGGYRFYDINFMRLVRVPEWKWLKQWNPHTSFRGYYGLDGYYSSGQ